MGEDHEKAMASATTRQVELAIEAYYREYGKLPKYLDELEGNNKRKKVFFEGIEFAVERYDLKIAYDLDFDGFVDVDGEKVKGLAAVWTEYKGERIKSWNDTASGQ